MQTRGGFRPRVLPRSPVIQAEFDARGQARYEGHARYNPAVVSPGKMKTWADYNAKSYAGFAHPQGGNHSGHDPKRRSPRGEGHWEGQHDDSSQQFDWSLTEYQRTGQLPVKTADSLATRTYWESHDHDRYGKDESSNQYQDTPGYYYGQEEAVKVNSHRHFDDRRGYHGIHQHQMRRAAGFPTDTLHSEQQGNQSGGSSSGEDRYSYPVSLYTIDQ